MIDKFTSIALYIDIDLWLCFQNHNTADLPIKQNHNVHYAMKCAGSHNERFHPY